MISMSASALRCMPRGGWKCSTEWSHKDVKPSYLTSTHTSQPFFPSFSLLKESLDPLTSACCLFNPFINTDALHFHQTQRAAVFLEHLTEPLYMFDSWAVCKNYSDSTLWNASRLKTKMSILMFQKAQYFSFRSFSSLVTNVKALLYMQCFRGQHVCSGSSTTVSLVVICPV